VNSFAMHHSSVPFVRFSCDCDLTRVSQLCWLVSSGCELPASDFMNCRCKGALVLLLSQTQH
jgi:hypothetical protein